MNAMEKRDQTLYDAGRAGVPISEFKTKRDRVMYEAGKKGLKITPLAEGADTPPAYAAEGAPMNVRALVGAAPTPEDRLATLRKTFPDAQPYGDENFVYTDPKGVRTLYNPEGLDMGDVPSVGPEIAQGIGGIAGGVAGAPGGIPGVLAGVGLGATGAEELYNAGMRAAGTEDSRDLLQRAGDAGQTFVENVGGQAAGAAVTAGVKAGARGLLRGGKQSQQYMQGVISDFDAVGGATPSLGQATKRRMYDTMESLLAKIPGGAGHIHKVAQRTQDRIGRHTVAKTPFPDADAATAGQAVREGIEGVDGIGGWAQRFRSTAESLYGRLDNYVPSQMPIALTNTRATMEGLAPEVTQFRQSSKLLSRPTVRDLAAAFEADIAEGGITYEGLKNFRSLVGQKLGSPSLSPDDIPRGELKQLYAALTADMEVAVRQQGPEAMAVFRRANNFYKENVKRIDAFLDPLLRRKTPEEVMKFATSGLKDGPTRIIEIMKSLTRDQRQAVRSYVIRGLGDARDSAQNAAGDVFSTETFLTNWNKLDPKAKNALFRGQMRRDLDQIARAAEVIRDNSKAFSNPPNSGSTTVGGFAALVMSGSLPTAAVFGSEFLMLPFLVGAGAGVGNLGARLMTAPRFVNWLARSTKIKPNKAGAHLGRLSTVAAGADPETRTAIKDYLSAFTPQE